MTERRNAALTELIYEAGLAPALWNDVLDRLCALLGTPIAATVVTDDADLPSLDDTPLAPSAALHALSGTSAAGFKPYQEYYGGRDPRWNLARKHPLGRVYTDLPGLSREAFHRSEIFCDFFRSHGMDQPMGAVLMRSKNRFATISTYTQIGRDFRTEQILALQRLAPHMTRALQVERELAIANERARDVNMALCHIPAAAFFVKSSGQVCGMNAVAKALLQARSDLMRLTPTEHLILLPRGAQETFRLALIHALRAHDGVGPVKVFSVSDTIVAVAVMVAPARCSSSDLWRPDPALLVFMRERGAVVRTDATLLAREFGLTGAEARVVAALAAGDDVVRIAQNYCITPGTVYLHVKHALAKTGAANQAQLVALALRGVSALAP